MDFSTLKLVIWDLDETLWHGIISDGSVVLPNEHIHLIQRLTDCGVICSICSKNDEQTVIDELKKYNLNELFVFKSINWSPKGARVKQIIDEMQLRAINCLFIDDNPSNRAEVQAACNDIHVEDIDIIAQLITYFSGIQANDLEHKRLNQYKVLEEKASFKSAFATNEDFLYSSNIRVEIEYDCINHLKRITELVQRSNQLNFTKLRSSEDELKRIINDNDNSCGYVLVSDSFGDYGIVGFYTISNNELLHFVFSCRTLGMGIEQYVYQIIGKPKLSVVGEVASDVNYPNPTWINHGSSKYAERSEIGERIILKGPCDLQQIFAYIADSKDIVTEFTYVADNGVSIEGHNHTTMISELPTLDEELKSNLVTKYPFCDRKMFETEMFSEDVGFVVLSLFTDPNLGLYLDKETGAHIAFGEWTNDITDTKNESKLINQELFTSNCTFSKESLSFIRRNLEFCGRLTPQQVFSNIKKIMRMLSHNTHMVLILGSETPFERNTQESYADREKYHQELNSLIREYALNENRISLIDVNKYVVGQESFTNNINHFAREIYFQMSQELVRIVKQESHGLILKQYDDRTAQMVSYYRRLKNKIHKVLFHD